MNYVFTDIEDHRHEYPDTHDPEIAKRFKDLNEYLTMAKKIIRKFGCEFTSPQEVQRMLDSEDAVAEIARHLMMADWRFKPDKGRTEYSYRNQCGKWAIQDYLSLFHTKANKESYSLDMSIGRDGKDVPLSSITEDTFIKEPVTILKENERKERVKLYIKFLMNNSKLTKVQAKCIYLRYFAPWKKMIDGEMVDCEGIESHTEIGEQFEPKISRQAVKQNLDRALYKLKMTAIGTNSK